MKKDADVPPFFRRAVLRPWRLSAAALLLCALVGLAAAVVFRTSLGLICAASAYGVFITSKGLLKSVKKRGCLEGTLEELDAETYLLRGKDGTEIRISKNHTQLFLERENGNAARILFAPVFEFSSEGGVSVPAPELKEQRVPGSRARMLCTVVAFSALTVILSWWLGERFPLGSSSSRGCCCEANECFDDAPDEEYEIEAPDGVAAPGASRETAIPILVPAAGAVRNEYRYIRHERPNARIVRQELRTHGDRKFDVFILAEEENGKETEREFWFDVTEIFGKGLDEN
ncbi:MAG: hypothetical protein ACI4QA_02220 [Candidatus Spyradosoma sp.]